MDHLLRLVRLVLFSIIFLFTGVVVAGLSLYYYYSKDLPKLDKLNDYSPPVISEVFDDAGRKYAEYWNEKRVVLPPHEIPQTIIQALVAGEDDRFFQHRGIDYQGVVRAFIENLKAGHVVQGGSTITQQVTKSMLLSSERSFSRKIKEAILATRIERTFNKDEILYLYLNQTFFGNRAYGVEMAAQNYFHKSAKELNIAESAMIAGLPKAPTLYAPTRDYKQAKQRQEYVLSRMYGVGYITRDQYETAKNFQLKIYDAEIDKDYNSRLAPWFAEYVRQYVQEKYGNDAPYTMGLKIETAVNLDMQKAADKAVDRGIRELDKRGGYSGPVKTLSTPEEIRDFTDQIHYAAIHESIRDTSLLERPTSQVQAKMPTPISPEGYYQAVVTKVDSRALELGILVGHQEGIIKRSDYAWARKRNVAIAGYDGAAYISDPKGTFHEGDVIWVKLKPEDPNKSTITKIETSELLPPETTGPLYFTLEQDAKVESALFSYEPFTGYVRAMIGGHDFKKSEFNRAMQAVRQTGSAIKPSIYAASLDKGYTPDTIIEDSPLYYEYAPGKFWSPKNYGGKFSGPSTLRSALVNSKNIVSVRILMDIGLDFATAFIRKLGVTTPIQKYYPMALGANDMKLYELSRAYGTFTTGGIRPELIFIKRITDKNGRVLEENVPKVVKPLDQQMAALKANGSKKDNMQLRPDLVEESKQWITKDKLKLTDSEKRILYGNYIPEGYAISPKTAYTMVKLMSDIVDHGTGYKVKELKRPAAGKTGTTNDETDTWFVGYVPDLFCGVWVGYDEKQKIGSKETGGKASAPIFLYYMSEVLKDKPVAQFTPPPGINLEDFKAPLDTSPDEDAETDGIGIPDASGGKGSGADFFIQDF